MSEGAHINASKLESRYGTEKRHFRIKHWMCSYPLAAAIICCFPVYTLCSINLTIWMREELDLVRFAGTSLVRGFVKEIHGWGAKAFKLCSVVASPAPSSSQVCGLAPLSLRYNSCPRCTSFSFPLAGNKCTCGHLQRISIAHNQTFLREVGTLGRPAQSWSKSSRSSPGMISGEHFRTASASDVVHPL